MHKITIKNRRAIDGQPLVGRNAQILIDGKKVDGCNYFKLEIAPNDIARVVIGLYADVEFDENVDGLIVAKTDEKMPVVEKEPERQEITKEDQEWIDKQMKDNK